MTTKRKFYRKVFHIEVLSEEPIPESSARDIAYMIEEGHCSGLIISDSEEEVDGLRMAALLQHQQSDPEFFDLTDDGEDV